MRVPDVAVAMDAGQHLALGGDRKHLVDGFRVTVKTSVLRHAPVSRLDLNRLMKVLERKRQ